MKKLKKLSLLVLAFILLNIFACVGVLADGTAGEEGTGTTANMVEFLENGGFETITADGKPEGWSLSGTTVLGTNLAMSSDAKTGSYSVKMYGSSTSAALLSQTFSHAESEKSYTFSAQLKTVSLTPTSASRGAEVDIAFRDANNATLQYNGANQIRQTIKTISGTSWQDVTFNFVTPVGTAKIIVYLRLYNGGGEIYWDDVSLKGELTPQNCTIMQPLAGATNLVTNGNFETLTETGGVDGWSSYDKEWSTSVSVVQDEGRGNVVKIATTSASANPWIYYRVTNLVPNATYQVKALLKTDEVGGPAASNKGPVFRINFQGTSGSTGEATSMIYNYTYKQWQEVAMQFVVPEGTTYAYVYERLYGTGTIYFDDVEIYMVKDVPKAKMTATHVYYTDWEQGSIKLDFLDSTFSGYTYDITITDGETVILDDTVAAADYIDYKFNLSLLTDLQKEYTLDVELKDADGNVIDSLNKDIYRYNRPTIMTETAQVKNGNGDVFYPVLGYHTYYEDLDECAQYGINVVRSYNSADGTLSARVGNVEDLITWLDTAWYDHGIMTLVQVYSGSSAGHPTMAAKVTETVNAVKNHPGVLGYLVQDEPYNSWNTDQVTEELKAAYKLIRSLDSDHLVAHVANRPAHWDKSIDLSDMVISDRYPTADEVYFRNLQYNYISNAKAYSNYEKPVWNLIQASSFGGYVPTGTKLRNMIYQTMFAGGDSLGYISVSAADSSGDGLLLHTDELQVLTGLKNGELDDAVKAFVTGEYPTFCELGGAPLLDNYADFLTYQVPEDYWYKAYYKNNELYLLVLNNENEAVDVSIPLVSTDGTTGVGSFTAEVVDNYSAANNVSGNGTFNATIPALDATLFKITVGEYVVPEEPTDPEIPEVPEEPTIVNLLNNGGFETLKTDGKPEGWSLSGTTVLGTNLEMSSAAKTGNYSAKMYGNTTGAALLSQIISNVEAEKTYRFSAQLRTVSLTPSSSVRGAEVDIAFRDANNATIQYEGANQKRQIIKTLSGENWQDVTFDFVAPEGTAKIIVYLRLYNGGGEIYWDDVVLGEVVATQEPEDPEEPTVPMIEYLTNGGFETLKTDGKPEGWSLSGTTVLGTNLEMSSAAKTGNYSAKMFGNTTGAALLSQIVNNAEAGKTYTFSAQLRTVSLTPSSSVRGAEVDIAFRDANNATIQYEGANQKRQIIKTLSGENWQNVTFDFVAPEGTAKIIVYLRLYNGGGEIYWDDISLLGAATSQE